MTHKFKLGQRGEILEEVQLSTEEEKLSDGVYTCNEAESDWGTFVIVEVGEGYIMVHFDEDCGVSATDYDGNPIGWLIGEEDFENLQILEKS